jgi:Asp-tRNA(Asn)/Glu-tRNA(Gln) amidotransferase A subunit family amidase
MRNPLKPYKIGIWALAILLLASLMVNVYLWIPSSRITTRHIGFAEKIAGLTFSQSERKQMLKDLKENIESFRKNRETPLENGVEPAIQFKTVPSIQPASARQIRSTEPVFLEHFDSIEELAFEPVTVLSALMRTGRISSVDLTRMYLERLKRYGPTLECVITLTEDRALAQARKADLEIASGIYRGPLHGIPWGAKDLLATKSIKTTWGALPYKDQMFDEDAAIVRRLDEAGAVLVAKLTMGALAWGDVWYGGRTRNPWDIDQGSSGSSAGSASATGAGLVGFAIGTETWGSIVSPSTRCGVTGLRPTFGRVSRQGAMTLSWSMDKIGPICRSAEDCGLVFEAIAGPGPEDPSVEGERFVFDPQIDLQKLRIGYIDTLFVPDERYDPVFDLQTLDVLRRIGLELTPIDNFDYPVDGISFILNTEAAAVFDLLTRSGDDDLLVRQQRFAWPNVFRQARLIPAVEYIQANRLRTLFMNDMADRLKDIDIFITPSYGGNILLLTNLTGHPAVVIPNGFDSTGHPRSITFQGNLNSENALLALAAAYQRETGFHKMHPDLEAIRKDEQKTRSKNEE